MFDFRMINSFQKQSGMASPVIVDTSRRIATMDISQTTRDLEDDSLSSRYVYPKTRPFINSDLRRSPYQDTSAFPEHNRQAVMAALKNLQEKIRRLEVDRSAAETNLRSLTTETTKFRDLWLKDDGKKQTKQSEVSRETQELETQLNSAEGRCNLLEKQLEYMRKLVQNAEKEKEELVQRQQIRSREHRTATDTEMRDHMGKIAELEREQLKLTATQTVAQNKIQELESDLKKERHHRKLMQEKTAEIQTAAEANRILMGSGSAKTKKTKKPATTSRPKSARPQQRSDHYHLNLAEIPFLHAQSTSPSHHVGANVQKVLSLLKSHNTAMCSGPVVQPKRTVKTRRTSVTSSLSSEESDLTDLLLQLHDEFAHMSFEHQELAKQISEVTDENLQEDLERELEELVSRMEAKGEQIAKLKRHQQSMKEKKKKQKPKPRKVRQKSAVGHYCGSDEVQVTTTIKTKGKNTEPIHMRSSSRESSLKMLKDMKKLQTTLRRDDLSWDC